MKDTIITWWRGFTGETARTMKMREDYKHLIERLNSEIDHRDKEIDKLYGHVDSARAAACSAAFPERVVQWFQNGKTIELTTAVQPAKGINIVAYGTGKSFKEAQRTLIAHLTRITTDERVKNEKFRF